MAKLAGVGSRFQNLTTGDLLQAYLSTVQFGKKFPSVIQSPLHKEAYFSKYMQLLPRRWVLEIGYMYYLKALGRIWSFALLAIYVSGCGSLGEPLVIQIMQRSLRLLVISYPACGLALQIVQIPMLLTNPIPNFLGEKQVILYTSLLNKQS